MGLTPKGRNWGSLVNWDDLGKFYAGFIISWTIILYSGVAWLIWKRNAPYIRIRNLPLAITAVSFLHVYLVKIVLAYTTNGHFTCSAEFWIMSIYLPFGIALFQANLAQLRSISQQQEKLIDHADDTESEGSLSRNARLWRKWQRLSHLHKTYTLIGLGMSLQLLVTGILYGTTPTLRGDWSSYGNISHRKGQAKCRESTEWIATAFWQLFFSWIYGPFLLYKIRKIEDTHHWRLQVILSVLSGLPGTPLWLAAVYSDSFRLVNRRWVPPMWLAPGIIVMQLVTIFFPVHESIQSHSDLRSTLSIIKNWEDSRKHLTSSSTSRVSEKPSTTVSSYVSSTRQAQMHTMAGLEKALAINPTPLLRFAATKDFTAENIRFLLQVRGWRTSFQNAQTFHGDGAPKWAPKWALENLFLSATDIYSTSVSDRTAEFPINIESHLRTQLDDLFSRAVPERDTTQRQAPLIDFNFGYTSMFTKSKTHVSQTSNASNSDSDSSTTLATSNPTITEKPAAEFPHHPGVSPLGKARCRIPEGFNEHVFDAAEESIKYLVLTNTWQKFVRQQSGTNSPRNSGGSWREALEEGKGEGVAV